jgi:hypothetical protein
MGYEVWGYGAWGMGYLSSASRSSSLYLEGSFLLIISKCSGISKLGPGMANSGKSPDVVFDQVSVSAVRVLLLNWVL